MQKLQHFSSCLAVSILMAGCSASLTPPAASPSEDVQKSLSDALVGVTANTYVGDYGQYVKSFDFEFEDNTDLTHIAIEQFAFQQTSKHPADTEQSFGAWSIKITNNIAELSVDPFLYTDDFIGEYSDEETGQFTFTKKSISNVKIDVVDDFQAAQTDSGMAYRIYTPETDEKLPLIVTFHGNGEAGTDNVKQMVNNRLTTKWAEPVSQAKYPCVVLGPQSNDSWSDQELDEVRGIIDSLIADGTVDETRVYVVGVAGFEATLRFCAENADIVAAALPILYWKQYDPQNFSSLDKMPLWMSIGENDFTHEAPNMMETAKYLTETLGNTNVKTTLWTDDQLAAYGLYGNLTHWAWIPVLNNKEMTDWLFSQAKSKM